MTDDAYPITERNRVRRMGKRAQYDRAAIYPILDTALLCHIAYVIDGQPYCTPTAVWREEDTLFWHGSSASRMLRATGDGVKVCLTVTHMDGLVMARSAFNHSINYRSVMAFGTAHKIEDEAEKRAAMTAFVERFFPGRDATLRPATDQEVKATAILRMAIEDASAKVRSGSPGDDEDDFALPVWAGVIPLRVEIGATQDCPRLPAGIVPGADVADYRAGATLDDVFHATWRRLYGG